MADDNLSRALKRSTALLKHMQEIENNRADDDVNLFQVNDLAARGANLIHSLAGPKSAYAEALRAATKHKTTVGQYLAVGGVLQGFHLDLSDGNLINIRHEVEAVVVSEILAQAKKLHRTKGVHPAAPVIVACAAAEEFLRNWCSEAGLVISDKRRSISVFAVQLRKAGVISLPEERRIQSWADYRNDAAHGDKWAAITDQIAARVINEVQDFLVEYRQVLT